MRIPLIAGCILCLLTPLFAARYALIAGQNDGGAAVDKLRYAEADARNCSDLLVNYASFLPENILIILHPDSAVLSHAIDSIARRINNREDNDSALFFLYFSGHANGDGLLLDSTQFAFDSLKRQVNGVGASMKIAIFDACQSGALVAFKGGKRAAPFFSSQSTKIKGEVWIASSSTNEQAQESETLKSSLFSFHFFNGIRGSADISGDKKVSLNEAYQYAYKKTIETSTLTSGIVQHPVYRFNISGEGDIILSDLNEKTSGISIAKACKGSFLIMSRDYNEVFADFRKEENKEIFIALAPGEYTIINAENGTSVGLYQFTTSAIKKVACSPNDFHKSLIQEMREKGMARNSNQEQPETSNMVRFIVLSGLIISAMVLAFVSGR